MAGTCAVTGTEEAARGAVAVLPYHQRAPDESLNEAAFRPTALQRSP